MLPRRKLLGKAPLTALVCSCVIGVQMTVWSTRRGAVDSRRLALQAKTGELAEQYFATSRREDKSDYPGVKGRHVFRSSDQLGLWNRSRMGR